MKCDSSQHVVPTIFLILTISFLIFLFFTIRFFMIWLFRYVSEYQTERELFQNLSNENLDKVWLLNCSSHSDHPVLIVNDAGENVAIGAEVQVINGENRNNEEAEDLSNFINCLMKKWEERNKKTSPNALARYNVSGESSGSNGMHNGSNQDRQRGADNIENNEMGDHLVSLGNLNIKGKNGHLY